MVSNIISHYLLCENIVEFRFRRIAMGIVLSSLNIIYHAEVVIDYRRILL